MKVQVRNVVPDDGSVHMLGAADFAEAARRTGAPVAHPLCLCVREISQTRSVPTRFHE